MIITCNITKETFEWSTYVEVRREFKTFKVSLHVITGNFSDCSIAGVTCTLSETRAVIIYTYQFLFRLQRCRPKCSHSICVFKRCKYRRN
jgi:hypothetical protein